MFAESAVLVTPLLLTKSLMNVPTKGGNKGKGVDVKRSDMRGSKRHRRRDPIPEERTD
jgi:hypothetical protein